MEISINNMKYLEAVRLISRIVLAAVLTIEGLINLNNNNEGLMLLGIAAILASMEH